MKLVKSILCFSLFLVIHLANTQEIPPIDIFTPQDYGAEDQNWSITQGDNNFIYIANNAGLLEYNGATWKLYESPNEDILRSVRAIGSRIYSGGHMDFGFWEKNNLGKLDYTSLVANIGANIKEDEEFWGIINIDEFVLFQSFERIYIYNTSDDTFRIINSDTRINKMFKVNDLIYFQKIDSGLFKIENGKEVIVVGADDLIGIEVVNMFNINDRLLILTAENGFMTIEDGVLESWFTASSHVLDDLVVYSGISLSNGNFILGTISKGLYELNTDGEIITNIDQLSGLSNNTVLSLHEDSYGNVWMGLDNGVNVLNLSSPYRVYTDKQGILGTIYTSALVDTKLYLGTNQGLFYKKIDSNEKFQFIAGTEGQVWNVKFLKGTLFCGHDNGTFIIENDQARQISSEKGTWDIKEIEGDENLLICGKYKGLSILEKIENSWRLRNKINGFDISSRYFEFISSNELLISHEYKGVYRIKVDKAFENVVEDDKIEDNHGVKSSVASYNGKILYYLNNGVFRYNVFNKEFVKDTFLSEFLEDKKYLSGKLISDNSSNRLWAFPKDGIVYMEPGKFTEEPEMNLIPITGDIRQSKPGYENILYLNNNKYLVGTTEGYLIIDLDRLEGGTYNIDLNQIAYKSDQHHFESLDLNLQPSLDSANNSLLFNFSVTNYNKLSSTNYQYRLLGIYDEWSNWSAEPEVLFENLPHGDYTFEVRAITNGKLSENTVKYNFSVSKPWYLKPIALAFYVLIAVLIAYLIHYLTRRYYRKQRENLIKKKAQELELEQLENQRQLIEFKNKNLQFDIENKNRELGIATMNLVKRNELLNNIKDELTKTKSLDGLKNVIKLINTSLNSTGDWKLFEEAFNNVDKDFMKKIKTLHPAITPNDLRLCTYLRLNLSSKEIAPLLNISHKSVEVKRYRLRKKMGLEHDQSLSNYIIEL